jgi:hypothetical protein
LNSADTRKLFANLGRDDAIGSHAGTRYQQAGMLRGNLANACSVATEGMSPQHIEHLRRGLGRNKEHHLALIGHIYRIETEQIAGRLHVSSDWQARLVDFDTDI